MTERYDKVDLCVGVNSRYSLDIGQRDYWSWHVELKTNTQPDMTSVVWLFVFFLPATLRKSSQLKQSCFTFCQEKTYQWDHLRLKNFQNISCQDFN